MPHRLLMPEQMARADRLTIAAGTLDGFGLMRRAASAVAGTALARFPEATGCDILCGPGNNGGDGYALAWLLEESGMPVRVWALGRPRPGTDAARAMAGWCGATRPLEEFRPEKGALVVDALFGAGLARPMDGAAASAAALCAEAAVPVLSVDLPSGVSGGSGHVAGSSFAAAVTVTFFRRKPGHLLQPGRELCGDVVVAGIGIADAVLDEIAPDAFENLPLLWRHLLPHPGTDSHKYARGHVGVLSGGPGSTGAARLAAAGAARAGAGAVTVLSPAGAMQVNAMQLTATMLHRVEDAGGLVSFASERRLRAAIIGPGFGVGERARQYTAALLGMRGERPPALVVDADAITSFMDRPDALFSVIRMAKAPAVLTPHDGEFGRLFPDLVADATMSKLEKARRAARMSGAVVVYKGPDTVIAAPDGRAAISANGTPWLATAGSGDVLCGFVAGLLAQGMPVWEAACAAVWMHAEAGRGFGPGLIADDLPGLLPAVLRDLL